MFDSILVLQISIVFLVRLSLGTKIMLNIFPSVTQQVGGVFVVVCIQKMHALHRYCS